MKSSQIIIFTTFLLLGGVAYGQTENKSFKNTKGTWSFPLREYKKVVHGNNRTEGERLIDYSLGIAFFADSAYEVKAVHDGIVTSIFKNDDYGYSIVCKYGDYFACYSHIDKPEFVEGDIIKAGQKIALLKKEVDETEFELLFFLFKADKEINVYYWFDWNKQRTTRGHCCTTTKKEKTSIKSEM